MTKQDFYTISEIADALRVSRRQVLNYCKNALDGAHPELEPIVTALYRYYEAAEAYASSNT